MHRRRKTRRSVRREPRTRRRGIGRAYLGGTDGSEFGGMHEDDAPPVPEVFVQAEVSCDLGLASQIGEIVAKGRSHPPQMSASCLRVIHPVK